jgi:peptidyl-prolyl cis-trans isomerase D
MLKAFRDNLKSLSWILWLTIGTFVLAIFAVWGGGAQGTAASSTAVATFGDFEISQREFQTTYQTLESNLRAQWGDSYTAELGRQMGLAHQAIDNAVARKIFIDEAEKLGFEATVDEVREVILGIPGLTDVDGRFIGQEVYENALRRGAFGIRYTPAEFEKQLAEQILIQKLSRVLADTTYVGDSEVEEAYRGEVETASIRYLRLPADRFADQVSITEADLETYFQSHLAQYEFPERRVAEYLVIDPVLLRDGIELTAEDVETYYNARQGEFTHEERVRARHILILAANDAEASAKQAKIEDLKRRLQAGEDFGTLAREHSQDDATRDRGGELGFFGRGRYNPALEEAAFSGQVGDLLGPIEASLISGTGFHLLEIQGRQPGGLQPLGEVEGAIRSRLLNERSRELATAEAGALADRISSAELGEGGLQSYADDNEAARFESTAPFGRDDNVLGIGRGTLFTRTAFGLGIGETSQPIEVGGGWAILHLSEILESRSATLDEVRDEVDRAVGIEKREEVARGELERVLGELRLGQSMDDAATALDVEVQESNDLRRDGVVAELGLASELSEAVFALSQGEFGGPIQTIDGPVIFHVVERIEMDPVELESRRPELRERISQERIDALLSAIVSERRRKEGVTYLDDRLAALGVIDAPAGG